MKSFLPIFTFLTLFSLLFSCSLGLLEESETSPLGAAGVGNEVVVRYGSQKELPSGQSDLYEKFSVVNLDGRVLMWVRPKSGVSVQKVLDFFKADPHVVYAEAPAPLKLFAEPTNQFVGFEDPFWNLGYQYPRLLCKQESAYQKFGVKGTAVGPYQSFAAVIDSGVHPNHDDLADIVTLGKTAYFRLSESTKYSEVKPDLNGNPYKNFSEALLVRNWDGEWAEGHGSHVCGIIGAKANKQLGVGVCPQNLALGVYKVFYGQPNSPQLQGGATYSTYYALYDLVQIRNAGKLSYMDGNAVPTNAVIPVNMSFGAPATGGSGAMEVEYLNYALENGLVPIAAMGNNSYSMEVYPASYPGVVSVGSVNAQGIHSAFSTGSERLSVSAPGEDIYSVNSHTKNGYYFDSGTSMAAPYATGLVAYLMTFVPPEKMSTLTVADIKSILEQSATDLGEKGQDHWYGYGLVNMEKATEMISAWVQGNPLHQCKYMKKPLKIFIDTTQYPELKPNGEQAFLYQIKNGQKKYVGMSYSYQNPSETLPGWSFPMLEAGTYQLYFDNKLIKEIQIGLNEISEGKRVKI